MMDATPYEPYRPLIWPDILFDIRDFLANNDLEIYVVGGAVRDALLHRPLHDIDLATSGRAVQLARQIANQFKGDFFVLDADRDVGRVFLKQPDGQLMLDVAHYRGATLLDDLVDRDFTLNAMAVNLKGDLGLLIDPLRGEFDIKERLLRRCREKAILDDPIRALRAVRQSSQLNMHIEANTLSEIKASANQLRTASPERIRDEWFKLLSVPRPVAAVRVADTLGLVDKVIPEVGTLHNLHEPESHIQNVWAQTLTLVESLTNVLNVFSYTRTDQTAASFGLGMLAIQLDHYRGRLLTHLGNDWPNNRTHPTLLLLAALLYYSGKTDGFENHEAKGSSNAGVRADGLRLSVAEKSRLMVIVRYQRQVFALSDTDPLSIYHFWRKLNEAGVDVCLLSLASYLATQGTYLRQDDWLMLVDRVRILLDAWFDKREELVAPPALVDGNLLIEHFQLTPGPILGELLEQIRMAQVVGQVRTRADALTFAATYLRLKS